MRILSLVSAVIGSLLLAFVAVAAGQDASNGDTATLDKLNAEDYRQTDTRGVVVVHAEYPESVRQRTADTF